MVIKPTFNELRGGPPPLDEAWWTALMAEEPLRDSSFDDEPSLAESRSKKESRPSVNWEKARNIYAQDEIIELKVSGYNRGGILVEGASLQGFVPLSHLVEMPGAKSPADCEELLNKYIGRSLKLKVIECDPERGRVVLSERAAQARPGSRTLLLETLQSEMRVWGTVTNITDFGVFVDLGGLEGLIHVSEISWGRVRHPSDSLRLGQKVEVFVINVDENRSRVALSLKRLCPNPWDTVEEQYFPGQETEAVVTSILPFGAFARLEEGLDGLIHVSEMGFPGELVDPVEMVAEGQRVKVRILQVDAARQRIGLSLRLEEPV